LGLVSSGSLVLVDLGEIKMLERSVRLIRVVWVQKQIRLAHLIQELFMTVATLLKTS